MATYQVHKVTAVPGTFNANDIFFVAPSGGTAIEMEMYVADSLGNNLRRLPTTDDINGLIDAALAAQTSAGTEIADTILDRDGLTPTNGMQVVVLDASADPTVDSSGATYIWRASTTAWIKLSEFESMDLAITWAAITDGPSSTPAQIDATVTAAHTHANFTELSNIGQDGNGNLTYNGLLPATGFITTNW